ncbi:hypothetical protein GCM10009651_20540 [Microbacterium natoriense]|uniref:hypothetical protein n=1 Tax=Microbacterium natoriense TaxID=284570 RepID=UPI0031D8DBCC
MWSWLAVSSFLQTWGIPFGAAVIGAVAGGLVTWVVGRNESRRARRERYGQALLDAMGSARVAVQNARASASAATASDCLGLPRQDGEDIEPLMLRREARDILVNAELASTLERRREGQLSMKGWALHHHESLLAGCEQVMDLHWLDEQLQLGEFLVVAWIASRADGEDFAKDKATVIQRFGPKYTGRHVPDYADRPANAVGQ